MKEKKVNKEGIKDSIHKLVLLLMYTTQWPILSICRLC